ncbi:MAG: GNAT family N-acetyltransferase [Dehalococcoidia bacterium]
MRIAIVERAELPETAFYLMNTAFPEDPLEESREFWASIDQSAHALVYESERLVGHAAIVDRTLYVAGRPIATAYVEYVCAEPRRQGHGSAAMRALREEIERRDYRLAALATSSFDFYARLGWRVWRGPTAYRASDGAVVPTPDEQPMVLDLGANVNLDHPIECDWRAVGDIW